MFGIYFLAGSNTIKKGVAIFLARTRKFKSLICDPESSFMLLDTKSLGKSITLANKYGPSDVYQPLFFSKVF